MYQPSEIQTFYLLLGLARYSLQDIEKILDFNQCPQDKKIFLVEQIRQVQKSKNKPYILDFIDTELKKLKSSDRSNHTEELGNLVLTERKRDRFFKMFQSSTKPFVPKAQTTLPAIATKS